MSFKMFQGEIPEVSNFKIGDGKRGNKQTIEVMKQVARERSRHPVVRQFALKILSQSGVPSHQYANEALAIGNFVKNYVRYVRDPDTAELLTDPLTLIDQIQRGEAQGDCDDMSLLIVSLLKAVGHTPYFRAVRYSDTRGHYNHIYVVCYEQNLGKPKQRIVLDAILKDRPIGSEIRHKSGDEFES